MLRGGCKWQFRTVIFEQLDFNIKNYYIALGNVIENSLSEL